MAVEVVFGVVVGLVVAGGLGVVTEPGTGEPPPPHSSTLILQEPETDTMSR